MTNKITIDKALLEQALKAIHTGNNQDMVNAQDSLRAALAAPTYKDSTPELHIGDSAFESWYSTYSPMHKSDKQRARDAYAAGMGDPLVTAAPVAVVGPSEAVAYLDIGTGGYLDLGTDLADEALSRLPKGRHALVIAGTYGIDGYIAAPTTQPAPQPAPVQEPRCNPHPKAPHGFARNSSHSAHRYVCECESWEPYDAGYNDGFQAGLKAEQALCELSDQTQEMEAQPRKAVNLTDEAIVDGFCSQSHNVQFVSVFRSGVRWAEKQHGIGCG